MFSGLLTMKSAIYLVTIITTICYAIFADDASDYLKNANQQIMENNKNQEQEIKKQHQDFKKYACNSRAEFDRWSAERKKEIALFKKEITGLWGEYREPANKVWVEYGRDKRSVSSVDFEKGVATVLVLVPKNSSKEQIRERLIQAVTRVAASKGSFGPKPVQTDKPGGLLSQPILDKQVVDNSGAIVTVNSVSRFAQGLAEQATVVVADSMITAEVRFNLAPDHIKKRAERFMPVIEKQCARYQLAISRVLATIHTESCFNPLAVSSANAIGLMQIVPIYGGREAYRYVYGTDAIPREESLLDPAFNIELGCAYIYLLINRHFGRVSDQEKNSFCTIAAYNTGPKNVALSFAKVRDVRAATDIINAMENAQKVYDHLIRNLPYQETRQYLADVVETMKLYR